MRERLFKAATLKEVKEILQTVCFL